jgi:radical SAM superfamily enzyme YgiQ (UPF0313 family)
MILEVRLEAGELKAELDSVRAIRIDAEGRWASLREGDARHRRLVSGAVRRQDAGRMLSVTREELVHERASIFVAELLGLAEAGDPSLEGLDCVLSGAEASVETYRERLRRAAKWTPERMLSEKQRYAGAYPEDVPILPPDRYADLVLMPATGCPNAGCTFCAFYRDSRFAVLGDEDFALHLEAVQELFGAALARRRGVFLGSANAFAVPQRRLVPMLERVRELPLELRRGIAGFWDPEHAPRRELGDWAELHALGVRRVHVGLETGDSELRKSYGKDPDLSKWRDALAVARAGGLVFGISVLALGDEAPERHERHRLETARFLGELDLQPDDFVYVSPLLAADGPGVAEEARRLGVELAAASPAKLVPYAAERFGYFA